jgi:hypothetical protein
MDNRCELVLGSVIAPRWAPPTALMLQLEDFAEWLGRRGGVEHNATVHFVMYYVSALKRAPRVARSKGFDRANIGSACGRG